VTMAQLMRRGPGSPERNPAQQRIDFGGRRKAYLVLKGL